MFVHILYGTVYLCENQQATIDLYTEHDITGWCHVNHRGYMVILCVLQNSVDNCNCNENCNGFVGWHWHICLSMSLVLW